MNHRSASDKANPHNQSQVRETLLEGSLGHAGLLSPGLSGYR